MDSKEEIAEMIQEFLKDRDVCRLSDCETCNASEYGEPCLLSLFAKTALRKADEVRKGTAKEIFKEVVKLLDEAVPHTKEFTTLLWLAGQIKTKYGVEVDE